MHVNLLIVDDFYSNPEGVRSFALSQEFGEKGNYPGLRTKSFLNDSTKQSIENLLIGFAGRVTNWFEEKGLTGSFQITTSRDRSWIHSDYVNKWAGVCYLTPDAPLSAGTGLFQYKKNNARIESEIGEPYDGLDKTKWDLADRVANRFNRLILYRSNQFHTSLDYFGQDLQSGRLFQVFFFDTER